MLKSRYKVLSSTTWDGRRQEPTVHFIQRQTCSPTCNPAILSPDIFACSTDLWSKGIARPTLKPSDVRHTVAPEVMPADRTAGGKRTLTLNEVGEGMEATHVSLMPGGQDV